MSLIPFVTPAPFEIINRFERNIKRFQQQQSEDDQEKSKKLMVIESGTRFAFGSYLLQIGLNEPAKIQLEASQLLNHYIDSGLIIKINPKTYNFSDCLKCRKVIYYPQIQNKTVNKYNCLRRIKEIENKLITTQEQIDNALDLDTFFSSSKEIVLFHLEKGDLFDKLSDGKSALKEYLIARKISFRLQDSLLALDCHKKLIILTSPFFLNN